MPTPPQYIPEQFIGRGDRSLEQRVSNIEGVLLYGDTPPDMFPDAEDRANKVFAYDEDGVPSLLPMETLIESVREEIVIAAEAELRQEVLPEPIVTGTSYFFQNYIGESRSFGRDDNTTLLLPSLDTFPGNERGNVIKIYNIGDYPIELTADSGVNTFGSGSSVQPGRGAVITYLKENVYFIASIGNDG